MFKPGEDEDNPWVPVKPLHRLSIDDVSEKICESQPSKVEKEAQADEYETDTTWKRTNEGADDSNDETEKIHISAPIDIGGEVSHILTSCEGPPDEALKGPLLDEGDGQHRIPGREGSPALHSPCPAQGGGENGVRNAAVYEGTVGMDAHANIGQENLESKQKVKNFLVLNTAAFFGWCRDNRGTNAARRVSTNRKPLGSKILVNNKIHQQNSHSGHPQQVGDRVRQRSDHAHHQGGPLSVGGHDHQAEPPDRVHVHGGAAQESAQYDDLRWDAGGCRVQQHSCSYHRDRQSEAVVGCGHRVDQPCQDEGDEELLQSEVDVLVGQVPPPKDKGGHTELENDVSSPSPDGGRVLSQKSSLRQCQQALSAPDLNQSDLWQLDTP